MHFWLGITTGPIVFIVALTGCIYAFQEEIQDWSQEYRFIEQREEQYLPPSELLKRANEANPGKHLHAIMYHKPGRAAKAIFYEYDRYYDFVYLDPYTGEVLKVFDVENSFFGFILEGHFYLWLPKSIGQFVVASATLIFLFIILSGIYLWWPRNKNNKRQKFTINWRSKWRRRNFDLHSVVGAYISLIAVIFVLTGLIWGFVWFRNGVYKIASGGKTYQEYSEPTSEKQPLTTVATPMDSIYRLMQREYPQAEWIELHLPETEVSSIAANANPDAGTYWRTDYRYFDQYTLKELKVNHQWGRYAESSSADLLMRMNYDIHVGGIFGFAGKVCAFLVSLLIASLPVTGFIMWYGRKRK